MPELPEVETMRRSLLTLQGETICSFQRYRQNLRYQIPQLNFIIGCKIAAIRRAAKYLLLDVAAVNGDSRGTLLIHLGMSGQLHLLPAVPLIGVHDHWYLKFRNVVLLYRDPRRFGRLSWFAAGSSELADLLAGLGVEPLSESDLARLLFSNSRKRQQSVKAWLLAGKTVCGVGNIYACESLFLAGIDPLRPIAKLSWLDCVLLATAIRSILAKALAAGGTTLRDFRNSSGDPGYFQQQLWVYDREGQPCPRCRSTIERILQNGRSTFFCRNCQQQPPLSELAADGLFAVGAER